MRPQVVDANVAYTAFSATARSDGHQPEPTLEEE